MSRSDDLKKLVILIVRELVTLPDELVVNAKDEGNLVVITIECNKADLGKIIGRGGKRAQALRTIIKSKAGQLGCRAVINISD